MAPQVLACHRRSYDKGAQIEQDRHTSRPWSSRSVPRVSIAPPIGSPRPRPPARTCCCAPPNAAPTSAPSPSACTRLLDRYGAAELQAAIREALDRDVPHPNAVRLALERRREARGEPPPVIAIDCPPACRPATRRCGRTRSNTYDQLKDAADD